MVKTSAESCRKLFPMDLIVVTLSTPLKSNRLLPGLRAIEYPVSRFDWSTLHGGGYKEVSGPFSFSRSFQGFPGAAPALSKIDKFLCENVDFRQI